MAGDKPFERLLIRPPGFWTDRNVTMFIGRRVVTLDPVARQIDQADGETIGYGTLVWAAGGSPRRLACSGHDLVGVHGIRTRADVDRMMVELATTTRVVVIGGG